LTPSIGGIAGFEPVAIIIFLQDINSDLPSLKHTSTEVGDFSVAVPLITSTLLAFNNCFIPLESWSIIVCFLL